MNKDKEPLMTWKEWLNINADIQTDNLLIDDYAKYHTKWHLNNVKEVVCEEVRAYVNDDGWDCEISEQSITDELKLKTKT